MRKALSIASALLSASVATMVASLVLIDVRPLTEAHGLDLVVLTIIWTCAVIAVSADILITIGAPNHEDQAR